VIGPVVVVIVVGVIVVVVVIVGVVVGPVLHTGLLCYTLDVGAFSNFQRGKAAAKLNWMNWIDSDYSSNPMYCVNVYKCIHIFI